VLRFLRRARVTSENEHILSRSIGTLVEASMRPRERPGTVLVRHAEHILELVRISSQTVTAVAALCGYENPSHFATAFRRVVGVSPRSYRE
jgi:AraC-like DNA-binding protein